MSDKLLTKLRKEGPHSLAHEELLILVLGDKCAEEVRILFKVHTWSEIKELVGVAPPMVGIRNSTIDRLYAMRALAALWFG